MLKRNNKLKRVSLSLYLARIFLGWKWKVIRDSKGLSGLVANRQYPSAAQMPSQLRSTCAVEEWEFDGQKVLTLTPKNSHIKGGRIIYLHGGAYVFPLKKSHWDIIAALIDVTGFSVTVPFYALAPENDARRGTSLIDTVYARVLAKWPGERIIVAGDSAGGNFALTLAIRRRDAGLVLPDRLILFSPWLDLGLRDERAYALEEKDIMLRVDAVRECGKWWAGSEDPSSAYMSPLYANLSGLPPISLFQGDYDILVFDARTFSEKATFAGVKLVYEEYPGAFHVFVAATFTREAKHAFQSIAASVKTMRRVQL
ncbi:alpha/beta hydrolase [Pseudomonas yamanorum]|uniref:alpha/beta hydrolase n=1 Tax=Pseudomonas yamanorum TaxID=515393 RepID=UPI0007A38401|nr:alpha/beta hydrolase [Pseudomonas yamanorum]